MTIEVKDIRGAVGRPTIMIDVATLKILSHRSVTGRHLIDSLLGRHYGGGWLIARARSAEGADG